MSNPATARCMDSHIGSSPISRERYAPSSKPTTSAPREPQHGEIGAAADAGKICRHPFCCRRPRLVRRRRADQGAGAGDQAGRQGGDLCQGPGAPVGARLPAGRPVAGDRAARAHAPRRQGRPAVAATGQRAARVGRGPGRASRRGRRARFRILEARLLLVFGAARVRRQRHHRGACEARARRRRRTARRRAHHLSPAARRLRWPPLRLAPDIRGRREPVRHPRRARPARQGPGPFHALRQSGAPAPGRLRATGQPVREQARRRAPRSGATATATCRRPLCTPPPAGSGPSSTGRVAETS